MRPSRRTWFRRIVPAIICVGVLCVGSGVLAYGALTSPSEEATRAIEATGAEPGDGTLTQLGRFQVTSLETDRGHVVIVEGVRGPESMIGIGCAALPAGEVVMKCGGMRSDGFPTLTIGRVAPEVSSVTVAFGDDETRSALVADGLFVVEGPPPTSETDWGQAPTMLVAKSVDGRELARERVR